MIRTVDAVWWLCHDAIALASRALASMFPFYLVSLLIAFAGYFSTWLLAIFPLLL